MPEKLKTPPPQPPPLPLPSFSHLVTVKLNHDNYLLWKAQLMPYLKGQNLFGFVDGTTKSPHPFDKSFEKPNPEYLAWQQQDQAIMSVLISSLSENIIAHVLDFVSSREIWVTLTELFAAKSQARLMQVQYQFATLKKGSDSIADYYQKTKLLRDTLAAAGKPLSSSEFITYLLAGLGSDFNSVVTSITTRVDPLSPPQVYSHLLTHESRLSHQLTGLTATTELSANVTYKPLTENQNRGHGFYGGRGGYRGRGRGRHAGRFSPSHFSPSSPTCQVCLKQGHTALTCYNKFNQSFQSPPPSSISAHFTIVPTSPSAPTSSVDNLWYPDSAATYHFTHDFSNLSLSPTEYKGDEQVCIGDGTSLPIQHVGSSTVPSTSGLSFQQNFAPRQY